MPQAAISSEFIRLANRYSHARIGERVVLVDDEIIEIDDEGASQALVLDLLARLQCGARRDELEEIGGATARELIVALDETGILRYCRLHPPKRPWQRQVLFLDDLTPDASAAQSRLGRLRVLVVGVGGIGAVVAEHMVRSGIGAFVLVDGDDVSIDNLNRQTLYRAADSGHPKVDVAERELRAINDAVTVDTAQCFVETSADVISALGGRKIDLIINAADRPAGIRGEVGDAAVELDVPIITAGVGRHVGMWGPLAVPRRTPCLRCFEHRCMMGADNLTRLVMSEFEGRPSAASFGPHNSVVASLAARDVTLALSVGFKHAASLGAACQFDFRTMEIERFEFGGPCACWHEPR